MAISYKTGKGEDLHYIDKGPNTYLYLFADRRGMAFVMDDESRAVVVLKLARRTQVAPSIEVVDGYFFRIATNVALAARVSGSDLRLVDTASVRRLSGRIELYVPSVANSDVRTENQVMLSQVVFHNLKVSPSPDVVSYLFVPRFLEAAPALSLWRAEIELLP